MEHCDKKREQLISFLFVDRYRPLFRDIKRNTENEKRRFTENYPTAEDFKHNYFRGQNSRTNRVLGLLQLPQFKENSSSYTENSECSFNLATTPGNSYQLKGKIVR